MADDPALGAYPYYRDAPVFERILARGRPLICPFGPLTGWVPKGGSVLDIGCGCGLWLLTLGDLGLVSEGTGCDPNTRALAVARRAAQNLAAAKGPSGTRLEFATTASSRDWPAGPFDLVSLIDVIHHIPPSEQSAFIVSAYQRVKRGGRLIYKDMASAPALHAMANRLHDLLLARQIIHYFPRGSAAALLTQSGGNVLHIEDWKRGPYAQELLVVSKPA